MESAIVSINLVGAVALLLFGLSQVKDGVQRAFGARLKAGLAAGTRDGLRSFLAGLVATIALQSSTATALMIASFAERNLVAPRMAQRSSGSTSRLSTAHRTRSRTTSQRGFGAPPSRSRMLSAR